MATLRVGVSVWVELQTWIRGEYLNLLLYSVFSTVIVIIARKYQGQFKAGKFVDFETGNSNRLENIVGNMLNVDV